jgi:hypothetical protein
VWQAIFFILVLGLGWGYICPVGILKCRKISDSADQIGVLFLDSVSIPFCGDLPGEGYPSHIEKAFKSILAEFQLTDSGYGIAYLPPPEAG